MESFWDKQEQRGSGFCDQQSIQTGTFLSRPDYRLLDQLFPYLRAFHPCVHVATGIADQRSGSAPGLRMRPANGAAKNLLKWQHAADASQLHHHGLRRTSRVLVAELGHPGRSGAPRHYVLQTFFASSCLSHLTSQPLRAFPAQRSALPRRQSTSTGPRNIYSSISGAARQRCPCKSPLPGTYIKPAGSRRFQLRSTITTKLW